MKLFAIFVLALFVAACGDSEPLSSETDTVPGPDQKVAKSFAYPVGKKPFVTSERDSGDQWYNAQDFGENNHLGEDWNKNSGGNTDCGEPVYASADGVITYAEHAGSGWGNVIIIEHLLEDGSKVQTLYGHLKTILRKEGQVTRRKKIGTIGDADGKYLCHLHFELRDDSNLMWDKVFIGYSPIRKGWLDPSEFIDENR
ncbi:MAG: M23 family metallopeptidase [Pyrinomonadaceae bacterium]|nr:M23 family metallopeptidase [Pyrinomonadaceae bacterium]